MQDVYRMQNIQIAFRRDHIAQKKQTQRLAPGAAGLFGGYFFIRAAGGFINGVRDREALRGRNPGGALSGQAVQKHETAETAHQQGRGEACQWRAKQAVEVAPVDNGVYLLAGLEGGQDRKEVAEVTERHRRNCGPEHGRPRQGRQRPPQPRDEAQVVAYLAEAPLHVSLHMGFRLEGGAGAPYVHSLFEQPGHPLCLHRLPIDRRREAAENMDGRGGSVWSHRNNLYNLRKRGCMPLVSSRT